MRNLIIPAFQILFVGVFGAVSGAYLLGGSGGWAAYWAFLALVNTGSALWFISSDRKLEYLRGRNAGILEEIERKL